MSALAQEPDLLEHALGDPTVGYEQQTLYLDRCRRARVGPLVTLTFENRRTLAFRIRELEHLARLSGPGVVRRELNWYAGLLPGPGRLLAVLAVREPGCRPSDRLNALARGIAAGRIVFRVGPWEVEGRFLTRAGGDRVLGPAFWVEFVFPPEASAAIARGEAAELAVVSEGYAAETGALAPELRRSLAADLGDDAWGA
jgi:hypothetical protein